MLLLSLVPFWALREYAPTPQQQQPPDGGIARQRIRLLAGWSPASSPQLPLRTTGQTCLRHPHARELWACYPHLLVVGMAKSGTTAVASYLLLHPQVRFGVEKESRYFEDPHFGILRAGVYRDPQMYLSVADNARRVNVDADTTVLSEQSAYVQCQRMAATLPPTSRFVVLLRNPLERMLSKQGMARRFQFTVRSRIAGHRFVDMRHFARCVRQAPGCNATELLADAGSGRIGVNAMLDTLKQRFVLEPGVVGPCVETASALEACMQANGSLATAVVDSFHPRDGLLNIDVDYIKTVEWALASESYRELRDECNACPPARTLRVPQSLDVCDGCRCACTSLHTMRSSLYRIQLGHCFEFLAKERFLFVDYADVLGDLPGVMRRIVAHAGLEPFDFAAVEPARANAAFDAAFPLFKGLAWSHDLMPAEWDKFVLPEGLQRRLKKYFDEDNAYLRELTGLALKGWD